MSASGGADIGASASGCHRVGAGRGVGSVGSVTITDKTTSSATRASRTASLAGSGRGTHAWALDGDLPAAPHYFARRGARPARRPIGLVRILRSANGGAILFEHGCEHLQSGSQGQCQERCLRVDEEIDEGPMAQRDSAWGTGGAMRDFVFMAAPSVRLWPRLSHHSCIARRADADLVTHDERKIKAARMNQEALQNIRVAPHEQ